jgi:3-oxoacyl-[acyl-carrier protein] reductase
MSLEGRVALVTGGGRGIGRAISLGLAEDGADVAVNYRKDADAAQETVAAIEALGRRAVAVPGAVDVRDECVSMVAAAVEALGPIGILVNNAGIASRGASVAKTDPTEVERLLRVHAMGPHWLCQEVLPTMRDEERGDIVFISSVATDTMAGGGAPYNMGKAAMEALALSLSKEVRHLGIHVNIVAPGLVDTEMGRRLVRGAAGVEDIRTLDAASPFGRVCTPEDVAAVVRFFVSDAASYLTGERMRVFGGGV